MKNIRNACATPRPVLCAGRAVGAVVLTAILGLSTMIPVLAEPASLSGLFARKYNAFFIDSVPKAELALTVHASSFEKLVETQVDGVPGFTPGNLIGGIHQGTKAVTIGPAAAQPARFEYRPADCVTLRIGEQTLVTGLTAAQARPMAALVDEGNNGLVGLNERVRHNGKGGYRARVAGPYIDTAEGYWLLWADAMAGDLFYQVDFGRGEFPSGLTIVDAERPVTISTEGRLDVRAGEPRVAFWKCESAKRGSILRYEEFGLVMELRCRGDALALETVRRVFKWAPVMRLAAESDPAAFKAFVHALDQARIATVSTPRLLIED